jgi:hypothetical protein
VGEGKVAEEGEVMTIEEVELAEEAVMVAEEEIELQEVISDSREGVSEELLLRLQTKTEEMKQLIDIGDTVEESDAVMMNMHENSGLYYIS